jgi:hypothetical protein
MKETTVIHRRYSYLIRGRACLPAIGGPSSILDDLPLRRCLPPPLRPLEAKSPVDLSATY